MNEYAKRVSANNKEQEVIRYIIKPSDLGNVLIGQSAMGIVAILINENANLLLADIQDRFPDAYIEDADTQLEQLAEQVIAFLNNPKGQFDAPLDLRGTDFQKKVWNALKNIPLGETATYNDIAYELDNPSAVRAVAGACGANHIAVVIPCHRVVRSDGGLSGYRWGVNLKAKLLEMEGAR